MSSECQRSVLSCSRCRKRKTRCDRNLPACSQCIVAKTECTGFSVTSSRTAVPRSVVRHLEHEIARLETELAQAGHLDALNGADILSQMPIDCIQHEVLDFNEQRPRTAETTNGQEESLSPAPPSDPLTQSIMLSSAVQSMISATLPQGPGLTDLVSRVRMGLTPSSASTAVQLSINNDMSRTLDRRASTSIQFQTRGEIDVRVLKSMPREIILSLTRKYIQTALPQYPFFHEAALWAIVNRVLATLGSRAPAQPVSTVASLFAPDYEFLILYLILAISVTLESTKGGHESRCMSLSASLFEEGIKNFSNHMQIPSDLAGLQLNLLILLYATINPRSANVWILSGAVMRSCLELGLHREPPETLRQSAFNTELRRRVFWSAYCMDRSICSALQRPLSIPDAAINTLLPSGVAQAGSRLPFLGIIQYHQLISEMIEVHFQGEPLGQGETWDSWTARTEERLRAWHYESSTELGNNDSVEFALSRAFMILHRPSPRVPMPSQESLLLAFESASSSAKTHKEHISSGFFRRPWISAHHMLEGAVVLLFCLRHGCATISQKFNARQIFKMSKLFTENFLAIASQGWSEVSNYAGVYERLLGSLLEAVFSPSKDPQEHFGPAQDAELTRLLYPGPAHLEKLRFGRILVEESSPFDFSLFNFDPDILSFDGVPTIGMDAGYQTSVDYMGRAMAYTSGFDGLGLIF